MNIASDTKYEISFNLITYSDGTTNYTLKPAFLFTQLNGGKISITSYVVDDVEYFMKWSLVNETTYFMTLKPGGDALYTETWYQRNPGDSYPMIVQQVQQSNGVPKYKVIETSSGYVIVYS